MREYNSFHSYCIYPGENIIKGYFSGRKRDEDIVVYDDENGFVVHHAVPEEPQVISITYREEEKAFYVNPSDAKLNWEDVTEPTRINARDRLMVGYEEFSLTKVTDAAKPPHNPDLVTGEKCPVCDATKAFAKTDEPYGDIMKPCV
ncbi:MAG: hypothetical protein LUG49_05255 [Oscillospiraceae bacterium]|nr:hypothetical protein [Oscillospiraceae bacterium]